MDATAASFYHAATPNQGPFNPSTAINKREQFGIRNTLLLSSLLTVSLIHPDPMRDSVNSRPSGGCQARSKLSYLVLQDSKSQAAPE